jgi:lipoyl(octanoyl) transferase
VPCGVVDPRYGVTSLADLGHLASMADVDISLRQSFEDIFGATRALEPDQAL